MNSELMEMVLSGVDGRSQVRIVPHGAHVTSWITADGVERLFLSSRAEFKPGVAIRGGVPIIFPQFAGMGPIIKHGFARTSVWKLLAKSEDKASFGLTESADTLRLWPFKFEARYEVAMAERSLSMTLRILNTDDKPFSFTTALHTYLRVRDVRQVAVAGLQGRRYRDSANGNVEAMEASESVRFGGEVDRIYFSTVQPILVTEPGCQTVRCSATGFEDTVIWNPGSVLSQKLADMDDDGYLRMVCVEAAQIGSPVTLLPGDSWQGNQTLAIE